MQVITIPFNGLEDKHVASRMTDTFINYLLSKKST